MKKTALIFSAFFLATHLLSSCGGEQTSPEQEKKEEVKTPEKVVEQVEPKLKEPEEGLEKDNSQANAKFIIKNLGENDTGNPYSLISVTYCNKTTEITRITGSATAIEKSEFKEKEIPQNALSACGAWWAGAGDYFYVVPSDKGVVVFQGWQDEGQEGEGYHWKKWKEIVFQSKISK